jgi:hypothetical protein
VSILSRLWHAPDADEATGCSTTGSSEAAMLGGLAPLERVGLDPAQGGWTIVGGPLADGLADPGWAVRVIWLFSRWEVRRASRGEEPLVRPGLLRNKQLSGGLIMFFFQYLVQAGLFFVVPLFLSVCLGLSALETGARLLLPSVTLLLAAIGIPRFLPDISPRLVVPITAFPSSRTPTSRRASRKPALARRRPTLRSRTTRTLGSTGSGPR